MREQFKPFLLGSLSTLVIASALFGTNAYAEPLQSKNPSKHLVTISNESESFSVSADMVDYVTSEGSDEGTVHVTAYTRSPSPTKTPNRPPNVYVQGRFFREEFQLFTITVSERTRDNFVKEVNKYPN